MTEAEKDIYSRGVVCLYPDPAVAELLALPVQATGSPLMREAPEDLHVTLAYFPDLMPEDRDEVIAATVETAMYCAPIHTEAEGIAQFFPKSEEDAVPLVLLLNPDAMIGLRSQVMMNCNYARPSRSHGFIPHMTLAYISPGAEGASDTPDVPDVPIIFDTISVKFGDGTRHDFKIGGSGPEVAQAYREAQEAEKGWREALQRRKPNGQFDGTNAGGGSGTSGAAGSYNERFSQAVSKLRSGDKVRLTASNGVKDGVVHHTRRDDQTATLSVMINGRASTFTGSGQGQWDSIQKLDRSGKPGPNLLTASKSLTDLSEEIDGDLWDAETPSQSESVPTMTMIDAHDLTATEDKAGKRMAGSWRERLSGMVDSLKEMLNWADYSEDDEVDMQVKMLNERGTLLTFKDSLGRDRWLAVSSNAFQDRENEIISTAALEAYTASKAPGGDFGPLRIWHLKGGRADIGDCDFSAVQGRFLIESGTFRNIPVAKAMQQYIDTCPEELGMSIGFGYPMNQKTGGVYGVVDIFERSICPLVYAANPFTTFSALKGGESMDSAQVSWLKGAIGEDLANEILSNADAATKALEGQMAFKADSDVLAAVETLKALAPNDAAKGALDAIVLAFSTKAEPEEEATPPPGDDAEESPAPDEIEKAVAKSLDPLKEILGTVADTLKAINASVESVSSRVETLEAAKTTETSNASRGAKAFRPTEDAATLVDDKDGKLKSIDGPDLPTSPVADYIKDFARVPQGVSQ